MLDQERVPYLKMLLYIAAADDNIDNKELDYFVEAALSSGLSHADVLKIKESAIQKEDSLEEIASGITEENTKRELLCDLLTLCYLDKSYSLLEQVGMRAICEVLEVDEERLVELENEAEESINNGKNPFYMFQQSKAGDKMILGLKKVFEVSKEGSKVIGKKVKKGGFSFAHSVSFGVGIVGTKLSNSVESAKQLREENKVLREKMKNETVSERVKQRVITQLHGKITMLRAQLKAEQERNNKNEEMINLLQSQIDDLLETMTVAENAKTA